MEPITAVSGAGAYIASRAQKNGESEAIKTLDNIIFHVFGDFNLYSAKRRLAHNNELEFFQNSLAENISSIPTEQLIEPPISVVGPTLESSKYYMEEECIREMFAKLRGWDKPP